MRSREGIVAQHHTPLLSLQIIRDESSEDFFGPPDRDRRSGSIGFEEDQGIGWSLDRLFYSTMSLEKLSTSQVDGSESSAMRDMAAICKEKGGDGGTFAGPWSTGEYAPRSDFIHNTLGWMILAIILAWSCVIMRGTMFSRICGLRGRPSRRRHRVVAGGGSSTGEDRAGEAASDMEADGRVSVVLCSAYCSAGLLSISAGVFLFTWVAYFLKPDDLPGLHAFVRQDLVSMQHIALSLLLSAAGVAEVTFAWMLAKEGLDECRKRAWIHQVWFANMALGGCLFLAHPQKTIELAIQHSVIGTSLVFGAHFLACEKLRNFEACLQWKFPTSWDVPVDLGLATVSFSTAAGMLIRFHDFREDTGHQGVHIACQGASSVVIIAFVVGSSTLVALLTAISVARLASRNDRRSPEAQLRSSITTSGSGDSRSAGFRKSKSSSSSSSSSGAKGNRRAAASGAATSTASQPAGTGTGTAAAHHGASSASGLLLAGVPV